MESHVSVSSNQENGNPANKEHYPVIDEVGEPLTVGYNVKQKDLSPKKPVSKKLYCDQCEYVTERKSRLENHKVSTHENNGYGCEYCDFRSGGKCEVESHKRQAHPELKEIKMLTKISCDKWDWIAKTHDGLQEQRNSLSTKGLHKVSMQSLWKGLPQRRKTDNLQELSTWWPYTCLWWLLLQDQN